MGFLKVICLESYTLFGIANKVVKPIILPVTRLYTTVRIYTHGSHGSFISIPSKILAKPQDDKRTDDLKKEKKLAKKLAILAAEPQYYQARSNKWTELKQKHDQVVAAKGQEIINVSLLDGKIVEGFSWEITPLDVAKGISNALAAEVYVAKVNNVLWDLERPLEINCQIQLVKFDSPDAKAAFWSTAAYTLAEALERLYCTDDAGTVCNIGSTQNGFFADIHLKNKTVKNPDHELNAVFS